MGALGSHADSSVLVAIGKVPPLGADVIICAEQVMLEGVVSIGQSRWLFVILAFAVLAGIVLGVPLAGYLAGFGVPLVPRTLIGLLAVPGAIVATALVLPPLWNWRTRRAMARDWRRQPTPEETAAMIAASEALQSLERSPLQRVIGVGLTHEALGITLELLAIELRGPGGFLYLRGQGRQLAVESQTRPTFLQPEITLEDDAGTQYIVMPGGGGSSAGGGYRWEVQFVPAPPATALLLVVTATQLRDTFSTSQGAGTVDGPWGFEVGLV